MSTNHGHLNGWCLLLAVVGVAAGGCGGGDMGRDAESPQHWRFAIEETIGSVQYAYAQRFKELIEQRTEGRIRVTVYPYGALGTSDQLTEQLDLGAIQFVMASPGHLGKLIPEVQVFLLHFLFSDDEELNQRVLKDDAELREILEELYTHKRMKLLAIYSEGWQVWTTQRPVRSMDDFRGMKFRVMTSPLLIAAFEAYGASPTPLPYSEVYSGLQLNMIDGQENPIFAIQEMSFYEVTDWMIFPRHAPFITTAVTEQRFFDSLSTQKQQLVLETIDELDEYILNVQREFNDHRLDLILQARPEIRMIELSDDERQEFEQAARSVRELFIRRYGETAERLIRRIEQAIREQEDGPAAAPSS